MVFLVFLPHLLHFMLTFADFYNILLLKTLWMQEKVSHGVIHPSFTPPTMALQTGLCMGVRAGLFTKTHLRNLETVCTDLLGLPRTMVVGIRIGGRAQRL